MFLLNLTADLVSIFALYLSFFPFEGNPGKKKRNGSLPIAHCPLVPAGKKKRISLSLRRTPQDLDSQEASYLG